MSNQADVPATMWSCGIGTLHEHSIPDEISNIPDAGEQEIAMQGWPWCTRCRCDTTLANGFRP